MTRCEHQDGLLKEQRETVCSLEADRAKVSPIEPCEVEGMSDVNGYTRSLGGMETPGWLVARIPDMNVPVCVVKSMNGTSVSKWVSKGVQNASVMACVSTCVEIDGRIQMGDGCGEPSAPCKVILGTAGPARRRGRGPFGISRTALARATTWREFGAGTSRISKETVARTAKMVASVV